MAYERRAQQVAFRGPLRSQTVEQWWQVKAEKVGFAIVRQSTVLSSVPCRPRQVPERYIDMYY